MQKFAAKSTYTFVFLALCVLIVAYDLYLSYAWAAAQRLTHWAVDGPGAVGYIFDLALFGMGGFVMTGLALTELILRASEWWKTAWAVALIAGLVNLSHSLIFIGERGWMILYRDLVSGAILGALITIIVAGLIQFINKRGASTLTLVFVSTGSTILLVLASTFVSLLVHCTSGDCL